jgi:hypothetical protein
MRRVAFLVAFCAACGSSSSPPGGAGGAATTVLSPSTFADAFAHASCDGLDACCGGAFHLDQCLDSARGQAPHATSPSPSFDAAAARACLDALGAVRAPVKSSCHATPVLLPGPPLPEPCSRVFAGTAAPGERCSVSTDCVAGATCDPVHGSTSWQCRTTAVGTAGDPCFESDSAALVRHTCPSEAGLFCDLGTHFCTPFLGLGAPCQQVDACGFEHQCDGNVCALRVGPGEECCWPYMCTSGYCGKDGRCAASQAVPPDAVCSY